jgi:hypothetical protein
MDRTRRIIDKIIRLDDHATMRSHEGRYEGKIAMAVLGGTSGADWQALYDRIKPDVLLAANGAKTIPNLDYWLLTENLSHDKKRAKRGESFSQRVIDMFHLPTTAKHSLINYKTWHMLDSTKDCIKVRVAGWKEYSSYRKYGEGLLCGPRLQHLIAGPPLHVGTVGAHIVHLAGLLGVREVHTIGFDLCFKGEFHHWYDYPNYRVDRYHSANAWVDYKGLRTQWFWIETAEFMLHAREIMRAEGLIWQDHSDGLLQVIR